MKKNNIFMGLYIVLTGLLLSIGPKILFPVCPVGDKPMKCWWTSQAEIGICIIAIVIGIMYLLSKENNVKKVLMILSIVVYGIAILIPAYLIGGCMKADMACNLTSFPVMYAISLVSIIVMVINLIWVKKQVN